MTDEAKKTGTVQAKSNDDGKQWALQLRYSDGVTVFYEVEDLSQAKIIAAAISAASNKSDSCASFAYADGRAGLVSTAGLRSVVTIRVPKD